MLLSVEALKFPGKTKQEWRFGPSDIADGLSAAIFGFLKQG
jgi:hypothetical protein